MIAQAVKEVSVTPDNELSEITQRKLKEEISIWDWWWMDNVYDPDDYLNRLERMRSLKN